MLALKIKLIFLWSFLYCCQIIAQNPDYFYVIPKYSCKQYIDCTITDATFLLNNDTIKIGYAPGNYPLGYAIAKRFANKKVNIKLTHPQFQTLQLDSVIIDPYSLRMLKKEEQFYIQNGQAVLLKNGRKFMAIKIAPVNQLTPEDGEAYINSLCQQYDLTIATNFRTAIAKSEEAYGTGATEKMYGCLNQELKYTYWLAKKNGREFKLKSKMFSKIRANKWVEWLGVPQSFQENITNGITIVFKKGTSSSQIEKIVKKYKLKNHSFYKSKRVDYEEHYFSVLTLFPKNKLMRNLMKESRVKSARPKLMAYSTCG